MIKVLSILLFTGLFTSFYSIESKVFYSTPKSILKSDEINQTIDEPKQILFKIERINSNYAIFYKANVTETGFDPKTPIVAFKEIYENESSIKKEISGFEWNAAYSYTVEERKGNNMVIALKIFENKKIDVYYSKEKSFALMKINNKIAKIQAIYIYVTDGLFTPQVEYIQFSGIELKTGKSIFEKVYPKDFRF